MRTSSGMGCSDGLELVLASEAHTLPELRHALRAWACAHGWTSKQAGEIALAVDEACTNVIRHGYGGAANGRIELSVREIEEPAGEGGVEIRIRDYGQQTDPAQIRGRDLEDIRPGGLGVHIIRATMSEVEYSFAPGGGMLLVMRKAKRHTVCGQKSSRNAQ